MSVKNQKRGNTSLMLAYLLIVATQICSCKLAKTGGQQPSPGESLFSGLWYPLNGLVSEQFVVDSCQNVVLSLTGGLWRFKPIAVGDCALYLSDSRGKKTKALHFNSVQVPLPNMALVSDKKKHFGNDSRDAWGMACLANKGKLGSIAGRNGNASSAYQILGYSFNVYDAANVELYGSASLTPKFECHEVEEVFRHAKPGNKLVITDIEVLLPDGSIVEAYIDTLYYDARAQFFAAAGGDDNSKN
jgi:hypothetical protein